MRYFTSIREAKNEISRDLKELAIVYQSQSVQDKVVQNDPDYRTHELLNYQYSISHTNMAEETWQYGLSNLDKDYLKEELFERLNTGANPGNAYKHDGDYWSNYLHADGKFSYAYPERLEGQLDSVVAKACKDRGSRQLYIPIWYKEDQENRAENKRVPCSIGYHLAIRQDKLYMNYIMRSCDFYKHWAKDVVLAIAYGEKFLQAYNQNSADSNIKWGSFTHTIFSLHGFAMNMKGIF